MHHIFRVICKLGQFLGHILQSGFAALNGFAKWCNSINEDSNLIGYNGLLDIMADYVYCSCTNLLSAKGQTDPKWECWDHVQQTRLVVLNELAQWCNSTEGDSSLNQYNQVIRHNSIFCRIASIASMITQLYAVLKKI